MKTKYWIILFAGILLISLAATVFLFRDGGSQRAEIWSEGTLIETVDLRRDQQFTVETDTGSNRIVVEDGKIRIEEASCRDQICVNRGACSGGAPIICLPNRLVIRFPDADDVDFIAG